MSHCFCRNIGKITPFFKEAILLLGLVRLHSSAPPPSIVRLYPPPEQSATSPVQRSYLIGSGVFLLCSFESPHFLNIAWNTTAPAGIMRHEVLTNTDALRGTRSRCSLAASGSGVVAEESATPYTFKSRLLVEGMTAEMAGLYSCTARNESTAILDRIDYSLTIADSVTNGKRSRGAALFHCAS